MAKVDQRQAIQHRRDAPHNRLCSTPALRVIGHADRHRLRQQNRHHVRHQPIAARVIADPPGLAHFRHGVLRGHLQRQLIRRIARARVCIVRHPENGVCLRQCSLAMHFRGAARVRQHAAHRAAVVHCVAYPGA